MSKIMIKTNLINNEENLYFEANGILNQNEIIYHEKEILVKISILENGIIIHRSSLEYTTSIPLIKDEKQNGFYELKDYGKIFFEVQIHSLNIKDNKIEADYSINYDDKESNRFQFKIEYR